MFLEHQSGQLLTLIGLSSTSDIVLASAGAQARCGSCFSLQQRRLRTSYLVASTPLKGVSGALSLRCEGQDSQKLSSFSKVDQGRKQRWGASSEGNLGATASTSLAVLLTAFTSALYGPLLDAFHTIYGVLAYTTVNWSVSLLPARTIGLTWWTPLLFTVAGAALAQLGLQARQCPYSVPLVLRTFTGVLWFTLQYWLSAYLDAIERWDTGSIALVLSAMLPIQWALVGASTTAELGVAVSTALLGPALELWLIDALHAYHYTHPEAWCHVPLWIGPVYAGGSLAVQQLARCIAAFHRQLRRRA